MNHRASLRPTPTNSPFNHINSPIRSPTKQSRGGEEAGLHLRKVIGTTTATSNGFDSRPSARQFAYTAGAAAVIATVGDDLKITQQFFRARPNAATANRSGAPWPATPTPNESRNRPLNMVAREQGAGGSPMGTPGRDWSDSPTGKSTTAKDRIKAATSVALSPNGKWVAVGETGYKPRVCVFRVSDDTSETPVATVAEHTFGVHALAFNPDSKYLASLGTVNDGFLYIWSIDDRTGAATLYASNKCTTSISSMVWMGTSIVTAGLRFVKTWRLDLPEEEAPVPENRSVEGNNPMSRLKNETKPQEYVNSILTPRQKVLAGKNCLLGDLLEANFVCVVPISDFKALVFADSGEVCLLDDTEKTQTFNAVANAEFRVTAARLDDSCRIHIAGTGGSSRSFHLSELQERVTTPSDRQGRRRTMSPTKGHHGSALAITAMATFGDVVVELDSKRGIRLTNNAAADDSDDEQAIAHQLPAHEGAVLGVQRLACRDLPTASFFTFSGDGTIQIWDSEGASVAKLSAPVESYPDMYSLPNELKSAAAFADGTLIATGDRYGTLTVLNVSDGKVLLQVRAHSAEITDINAFTREGIQLLATAGRDRTVQLFNWTDGQLNLSQTMDEHAGAVTGLLSTKDGAQLLSCSTDRSVVVRQAMLRDNEDPYSVAYLIVRTIQLKSAPTSICQGAQEHTVIVSATDRTITNFNIKNGQTGFNFKSADSDGGESAVMSKILYASSLNGSPAIIGVSSSDKSVRLYTDLGWLIARDWGHTEGITDVTLLPAQESEDSSKQKSATLVSVAADSTVFMWDTTPEAPVPIPSPSEIGSSFDTPAQIKPLPPMAPPLRKIISAQDLGRYKRDPSPTGTDLPLSPQRLRKKTSRMSVAQPPKLEPSRSNGNTDPTRRRKSMLRSPSPPSPKNPPPKKDFLRRQSIGMTLRSKSTENIMNASSASTTANTTSNSSTGFGSLTASTESVRRTLRAYRKKLAAANAGNGGGIPADTLRELEKELKLTARAVSELKTRDDPAVQAAVQIGEDEAAMQKFLDHASDKMMGLLDERIKQRVESQVRNISPPMGRSPSASTTTINEVENEGENEIGRGRDTKSVERQTQVESIAGAMENISLGAG